MNKKHSLLVQVLRAARSKRVVSAAVLISVAISSKAQTGNGVAGLQQANTLVGSYFDYGVTLLYSIGAVVGLVGAIKVYNAWSHGDQQTNKLAASWFGACIFLVVVAAVLKSFFGVS